MIFFPHFGEKGKIHFAKNSDREPDEAQIVEIIPSRDHLPGSSLKTTYIEIPQVSHTFGIIISRPYWMWGAEMGVNEFGVAIGNEAIFTKRKREKQIGLIGMDLLRLALERARDRFEAADVITSLVKKYGQEGPCGHRNKKLKYDNAFLITDGSGAIILEIYGREWAQKEVHHTTSISNIISFTTDYDIASDNLMDKASKKVIENGKLNIFKSYSDWLYTTFAGGKQRKELFKKLTEGKKEFQLFDILNIMRSHQIKDFHPARGSNGDLCMHTGDPLIRISQTAGSLVVEYESEEKFYVYATGTPLPCTSFFIPVDFKMKEFIPGDTKPHGVYTPGSWWWEHEILNRYLSTRWKLAEELKKKRDALEKEYLPRLKEATSPALREEYIERIREIREEFLDRARSTSREKGHYFFKLYLGSLNRNNELPFKM